jgi:hypothetical protein
VWQDCFPSPFLATPKDWHFFPDLASFISPSAKIFSKVFPAIFPPYSRFSYSLAAFLAVAGT